MKTIVFALAFAVSVLCAGTVFLLWKIGPPGPPAGNREEGMELGDRMDDLSREVARLSGRIDALERTAADGGPFTATAPEVPAGGAEDPDGTATPTDPAPASPEPTAAAARKDLASADLAKADRLKDFVAQVIRQERDDRQRRQQAEARQRMEEWKSLNEGPYGKNNYRVNSLARKLGLSEAQKQYYHAAIQEQEPRLKELQKDVKWSDAESRESYRRSIDQLQQHFDGLVKNILSQEQRQQYEGMPAHERSLESGMGRAFVSLSDGGTDVLGMPLPPPDAVEGSFSFEIPFDGALEAGPSVQIFGGESEAAAEPPAQEAGKKKPAGPEKPAGTQK